jgi:uncharacterized protein (UPF0210 family)
MDFLDKARRRFEENGYEVQMARIASQPAAEYLAGLSGAEALEALCELDLTVAEEGVLLSVGPVNTGSAPYELAPWVAEVVAATSHLSASVEVASSSRGVDLEASRTAAEVMARIAGATSGGEGNFRFAAAANIRPGTPFFPVAYHDGEEAFSIGLESAGLVKMAFTDAADLSDGKERLARAESRRQHRRSDRAAERCGLWRCVDSHGMRHDHRGPPASSRYHLWLLGVDAAGARGSGAGAAGR